MFGNHKLSWNNPPTDKTNDLQQTWSDLALPVNTLQKKNK